MHLSFFRCQFIVEILLCLQNVVLVSTTLLVCVEQPVWDVCGYACVWIITWTKQPSPRFLPCWFTFLICRSRSYVMITWRENITNMICTFVPPQMTAFFLVINCYRSDFIIVTAEMLLLCLLVCRTFPGPCHLLKSWLKTMQNCLMRRHALFFSLVSSIRFCECVCASKLSVYSLSVQIFINIWIFRSYKCTCSILNTIANFFTARCYASAVLAMVLCLCLSQVGVLLKRLNVGSQNNTTR